MPRELAVIDPSREADWPAALPSGVRRYLSALAIEGPARFLANGRGVKAEILRIGDQVAPLLVSDGTPGKAAMIAPLGHHVYYPIEEIAKRATFLRRPVLRVLCAPLIGAFRAGQLNKAVFFNHWLMTSAPPLALDAGTWAAALRFVATRHPEHAVVVQDVVRDLDPEVHDNLRGAGAWPVATRRINVFDPARQFSGKANKTVRNNLNVAQRLLAASTGNMIGIEAARRQTERLAALYRAVYIGRHASLNPDYTRAFFDLILRCDEFLFHGWTGAHGDIEAFNVQRLHSKRILWSAFGAVERPAEGDDLYLLVTAVDLATAKARDIPLDWGAGADEFKQYRGATPHKQVEMVFCPHLPWHRRAVWALLGQLRAWRG